MTILSVRLIIYSVLVLVAALLFNFSADSDLILSEKQVLLSKTMEDSFNVVGDLEKFSEWFPGVSGYMEVESGPKTKGKRYRETINIPGIGNLYYVHTLLKYEPPGIIEFVDDSWLHLRYKIWFYESEPYQGQPRTMLSLRMSAGLRTYWFRYVAAPFFQFFYSQRLRSALFNLRYLVDHY